MQDYWTPTQPNGWYPKLSPDGRYILYGNWAAFVADLWADPPTERHVVPVSGSREINIGWYSDTEYLIFVENTYEIYRVSVSDFVPHLFVSGAAWNFFDCDSGHWYGGVPQCVYDGQHMALDGETLYGGTVKGAHFVSMAPSRGHTFAHYINGSYARQYLPENRSRVSRAGDVSMGYFGACWLARVEGQPPPPAIPNQAVQGVYEDATMTPWRRDGCHTPIRVNNVLWLWAPIEDPKNPVTGTAVVGKTYGETAVIYLPEFPAIEANVAVDIQRPDTFLIAGNDTKGFMQVRRVRMDAPRVSLTPPP